MTTNDLVKENTPAEVGESIRKKLLELQKQDGFKRTQRWLHMKILQSKEVEMSESRLSNSISGIRTFTRPELNCINRILGTDF